MTQLLRHIAHSSKDQQRESCMGQIIRFSKFKKIRKAILSSFSLFCARIQIENSLPSVLKICREFCSVFFQIRLQVARCHVAYALGVILCQFPFHNTQTNHQLIILSRNPLFSFSQIFNFFHDKHNANNSSLKKVSCNENQN